MKNLTKKTSYILIGTFLLGLPIIALAQRAPRIRASLNASVTQRLGIDTDITITYCRPGVKGRVIWGDLVPYNKIWRAGANENTTIEFNNDLVIEGKTLPAGKYGFWLRPTEKNWTVIFNNTNDVWGMSFNAETVALELTVTPAKVPHKEWLEYGFEDLADTSATAYLHWEELKIPFKIQLTE